MRGARGVFLLHFLPRKSKKAGQESHPENAAQHFEEPGCSGRPPIYCLAEFRRTIFSDVIARSGFTTAQHLAGSSSSATTACYDRLPRENVQEAINYRSDAPSPTGVPL